MSRGVMGICEIGLKSLVSKFETKNSESQNLTKSLKKKKKIRERKIEKFMREFFSIGVC